MEKTLRRSQRYHWNRGLRICCRNIRSDCLDLLNQSHWGRRTVQSHPTRRYPNHRLILRNQPWKVLLRIPLLRIQNLHLHQTLNFKSIPSIPRKQRNHHQQKIVPLTHRRDCRCHRTKEGTSSKKGEHFLVGQLRGESQNQWGPRNPSSLCGEQALPWSIREGLLG